MMAEQSQADALAARVATAITDDTIKLRARYMGANSYLDVEYDSDGTLRIIADGGGEYGRPHYRKTVLAGPVERFRKEVT